MTFQILVVAYTWDWIGGFGVGIGPDTLTAPGPQLSLLFPPGSLSLRKVWPILKVMQ